MMHTYTLRKELSDGVRAELMIDSMPTSPREWDNIGEIVGFHKKYELSDNPKERWPDGGVFIVDLLSDEITALAVAESVGDTDWDHFAESWDAMTDEQRGRIIDSYDGYLGAVTVRDRGDGCFVTPIRGEDADRLEDMDAIVIVTPEKIQKEYGEVTPETLEKVTRCVTGEIKEFSTWMEGDVWGARLTKKHSHDDGCVGEDILDDLWGLFGFDYAEEHIREVVESNLPTLLEEFDEADWEEVHR